MNPDYKEIEKYLLNESFQRWLNGTANISEKNYWQSWLNKNPVNKTIHFEALTLWKTVCFKENKPPNVDAAWKALSANIKAAPVSHKTNKLQLQKTFNYKTVILRVAAVIVIFATVFVLMQRDVIVDKQPAMAAIKTVPGQQQRVDLPDGSFVIINANSVLKYPQQWTAGSDAVYHLDGEAYFKIAKQKKGRVCRVLTKDGEVQVLGTRFSMNTRKNDTRVSLEKGLVEVVAADSLSSRQESNPRAVLNPGQYLLFHNGIKTLQVKEETEPLFLNWWQERFIFKETLFSQIKERLEQTYNLDIRVQDKSLLSRKLSGTIEKENLDLILQAIALILQADYHKQGQTVVFNKAENEL